MYVWEAVRDAGWDGVQEAARGGRLGMGMVYGMLSRDAVQDADQTAGPAGA